MKNYLLLLSLFLMSLLGAKGIGVSVPSGEGMGVECVLQTEAPVEYILPSVIGYILPIATTLILLVAYRRL